MVVGAAACPAAAAQGHYAISTEQIAATVSRMGMQVSPEQVTLLTDVVATKQSPTLEGSLHRALGRSTHDGPDGMRIQGGMPSVLRRSSRESKAMQRAGLRWFFASLQYSLQAFLRAAFVVRSGSPATLLLDSDHVHIRLSVICLENGAPGQTIRVSRARIASWSFTAQVIDGNLLKGRL